MNKKNYDFPNELQNIYGNIKNFWKYSKTYLVQTSNSSRWHGWALLDCP